MGMMYKSALPAIAAVLLFLGTGAAQTPKKSAFSKPELEAYVRHLWVIPTTMGVVVGDPKPSTDVPGFEEVSLKITQGQVSQDVLLYVSKDGSKILQGNAFDINFNPFKKDLDKINTNFQPSLGTAGAPVVAVLFSDFQCPYCKIEGQMLRQNLISNYPTQVRLYFVDYPLEQLHAWAKPAAVAGRCVFHQDPAAFWEYHDWIYGRQESITAENLKSIIDIWAKDRKDVDAIQLGTCIQSKDSEKEVEAEQAKGKSLQVEGTPTLFLNGRRLSAVEWPQLKATIDNEIEYQKVAKNAGEDCGCEVKQLDVPGLPKTQLSPIKKN
jgi:protein-disulfide isomerase